MENNNKDYWNKYWEENKEKKTFFNSLVAIAREYYFAKAFAKFIAKNYDISGKSICEIGVGSGLTLNHLKTMGAGRCVGIDYSEKSIEMAKEKNKSCEFILGDAYYTGLANKEFDLVYSLGFLEHYDKENQKKLIEEQKRIAKECVFIEVPYDIFYFRWLFALNRKLGRTTTFSDEELFTPATFANLGLTGNTKLMPTTFYLTIGHFEYL
jgi:ubiquinone/menaquinone biosynthesis C-methylase UbiE